jgi:hypothetical protein
VNETEIRKRIQRKYENNSIYNNEKEEEILLLCLISCDRGQEGSEVPI